MLILLLNTVTTAAAEPIKLEPRLVPGDSLHYTQTLHTTFSNSRDGARSFDITAGESLSVESALDDGSVTVRETIDQFEASGPGAESIDPSTYVGAEFTFTLHPDGTVSDFQMDGDDTVLTAFGGATSFTGNFPPDGLEIGQSYDGTTELPIALPGADAATVPVRTTLDALVVEQDRPAARVVQVVDVPELEVPFGQFDADSRVKVSADGTSTYLFDLDTGWPLRVDGVTSYTVTLENQGKLASVNARVEMQFLLDDQTLRVDD